MEIEQIMHTNIYKQVELMLHSYTIKYKTHIYI